MCSGILSPQSPLNCDDWTVCARPPGTKSRCPAARRGVFRRFSEDIVSPRGIAHEIRGDSEQDYFCEVVLPRTSLRSWRDFGRSRFRHDILRSNFTDNMSAFRRSLTSWMCSTSLRAVSVGLGGECVSRCGLSMAVPRIMFGRSDTTERLTTSSLSSRNCSPRDVSLQDLTPCRLSSIWRFSCRDRKTGNGRRRHS